MSSSPSIPRTGLLDLPNELLMEIGNHLDYEATLPTASFAPHYGEARFCICRRRNDEDLHPPSPYFSSGFSRDLRAFRWTCHRVRNAVTLTGLHVTVRTIAQLKDWSGSDLASAVS